MTAAPVRAPDAWQRLTDEERAALAGLALKNLFITTMESRGRDSLDFYDVGVLCVRDALARAFLAGAGRAELAGLPPARKSRRARHAPA